MIFTKAVPAHDFGSLKELPFLFYFDTVSLNFLINKWFYCPRCANECFVYCFVDIAFILNFYFIL